MNRIDRNETAPLAISSLALSCLGAISLGILAIPGIICGILAKSQISRGEYSGRNFAHAGIIVGSAVLALYILLPLLLFGGPTLALLASLHLEVTIGITAILIFLGILPFVFTGLARRRDSKKLRSLVELNRNRA